MIWNNKKLADLDRKIVKEFAKNDMKIRRTADALHFHSNSIDYHLRKVESVTGLNPKNFYDLNKLLYEMED